MQTFVADVGFNYSAPYWMGEFGTGDDSENWGKIGKYLFDNIFTEYNIVQ